MTLKEFRQSKNLSQESFARGIGYTLSMYAKVEQHPTKASRKFIEKVKAVYPEIDIISIFFAQ